MNINRDFTMLGSGLIFTHLVIGFVTQTTYMSSSVMAVIGLVLIVGSRMGFWGKKKI